MPKMKPRKTLGQIAYEAGLDSGGTRRWGLWQETLSTTKAAYKHIARAVEREVLKRLAAKNRGLK